MALEIEHINPFRFYDYNTVDNVYTLASPDVCRINTQYQRATYVVNSYPVFMRRGIIQIQLKLYDITDNTTLNGNILLPDGSTVQMAVNRVFSNQLVFTYTPLTSGIHKITISLNLPYFSTTLFTSDEFIVKDSENDLIKFAYSDSQNRYGGYFFNSNGFAVWEPIAYYTGFWDYGESVDDQTVYNSQNGNVYLIDSNPQQIVDLTLTEIKASYIDTVKRQTICDNFYMNDVRYTVIEFKSTLINETDLATITMKLSRLV